MNILGYVRPDGSVGFRNYVLVLPTCVCSSHAAKVIGRERPDVVAVVHQHGCAQVGTDVDQTARTLIGLGANPNVAAVLVTGLGCETINAKRITAGIAATGKAVEAVVIQDAGGTRKAIELGLPLVDRLRDYAGKQKRERVGPDALVLALECGGSDACSGIAANPAAGTTSDLLVEAGGTVILSETTEFIGAEHLLCARCVNDATGDQLVEIVKRVEDRAHRIGVDIRGANPAPGNLVGGITTIEEKALGCTYKAGTAPIQEVLEYGVKPTRKGLVVMDTPGQDVESVIGMVAGGAQVVVFTTGRGSPTGCPIAPVIKVASNSRMYARMEENMDINAGTIVEGTETVAQVGRRIFEKVLATASGERTKAELLGHDEFGLYRIAPTF
ncbi:MAG: altronate dehydratase [Planctomycetes bacterium]|nr:altronate dehydratase [Planctomycetota bacterium]